MKLSMEQAKDTSIVQLPKRLTVGGDLYIDDARLVELADELTIGGRVYVGKTTLSSEQLQKVRKLKNGEYKEGEYLYADSILTHVKKVRQVGRFTFYLGAIKGKNVVSDGLRFAHCDKLRDGIEDLLYKQARKRGASQYRHLAVESELHLSEAAQMYRILTGACRQGVRQFIDNLEEIKEVYTVGEIIELTKGKYGSTQFATFFVA